MATGGPVKLTCPICLKYFKDRVTIVECSHSFCGACLTQRWKESEESCPLCKETIQTRDKYLKMVTEERDKLLAHKESIEKNSQDLLERTKSQSQKTVAEFQKLCEFLEEQKKLLLGQTAVLEEEIERKKEEYLDRVSRELSFLESVIRDMEEKQQQQTSEHLQDVRSTLKKYGEKQKSGDPEAFLQELKWKVCKVCVLNDSLEDHMKQFKATVNVTLDPDTANPQVALSEESIKQEEDPQELPNNAGGLDSRPCVMECEEHPHHPRAVPGASSSSFSSHQTILDAAPMAVPSGSVSGFTEGASTEPAAAPSAAGTLQNALSMSGSLEEVYRGPKKAWSHKRILESATAQTEAEESDQQEDTSSGALPPIAEEYEPGPQILTSTEKAVQMFAAAGSQERIPESERAQTEAVESDQQEEAFSGSSTQGYEPEPSVSTFPESPEPPHLTPATAMEEEAPLGAKQLSGSYNRFSLQEPVMVTSLSLSGAVPGASSSSFNSHQMILDATQMAVPSNSVSGFPGGASTEPAAPSEARTFRSALSMSRSIEKVYKGLAESWSQEKILKSGRAQTETEESHQQEETFSRASPPEYEPGSFSVYTGHASMEPAAPSESRTESRSARSMLGSLEEVYKGPAKASSQERILESERAQTEAEKPDQQEEAFSGAPAQESELEPQPSGSTFPGSPELPQPTPRTARAKGGPLGAKRLPRKVSARKKSSRTALTGTTTSAGIPGPRASSKVMRPTKGRRTSIVWEYCTQVSKFWATCNLCKRVVKIGNPTGCGILGTSFLRKHLKRDHPCTRHLLE